MGPDRPEGLSLRGLLAISVYDADEEVAADADDRTNLQRGNGISLGLTIDLDCSLSQ